MIYRQHEDKMKKKYADLYRFRIKYGMTIFRLFRFCIVAQNKKSGFSALKI